MARFLNKLPDDATHKWPEWALQAYVVQEARKDGYLVVGDMATGKRNPGMAKAVGLIAGHPDLSFWLSGGRVKLIELKTSIGRLSQAQIDHHGKLTTLGHNVSTVFAQTPLEAWEKVKKIISE